MRRIPSLIETMPTTEPTPIRMPSRVSMGAQLVGPDLAEGDAQRLEQDHS